MRPDEDEKAQPQHEEARGAHRAALELFAEATNSVLSAASGSQAQAQAPQARALITSANLARHFALHALLRQCKTRWAAGPDRTTGTAATAPRDWGFVLASVRPPVLRVDGSEPFLRTLTQSALTADARAAARTRVPGVTPSTLVQPQY